MAWSDSPSLLSRVMIGITLAACAAAFSAAILDATAAVSASPVLNWRHCRAGAHGPCAPPEQPLCGSTRLWLPLLPPTPEYRPSAGSLERSADFGSPPSAEQQRQDLRGDRPARQGCRSMHQRAYSAGPAASLTAALSDLSIKALVSRRPGPSYLLPAGEGLQAVRLKHRKSPA
jgi:hypothetical protein